MNLINSLLSALGNLRVNKMRSFLTMLGVIIGVSAVIVMVSIVEGARASIVSEFERLGSKLIIITYEPNREDRRKSTRRIDGLTMEDMRAIQEQCDLIQGLSAEMSLGNNVKARHQDHESAVNPNGVQPDYGRLRDVHLTQGRFINDQDLQNWSKVCVIGSKVRNELLPGKEPIGEDIDVQGITLKVVGVLEPKGKIFGEDADKVVLLPLTTVQKRFLGRQTVDVIWAQPYNVAQVNPAMDQVWELLMRRYDNLPGFRVDSQENILNSIGRVLTIFGLLTGGIASLALLVGGIGIMNIMLVSVTERTREIGLRKAIGARRRDILIQFLIESATLSGAGGLIGILFGAGFAYGIGAISKQIMSGGIGGKPGLAIHLPAWAVIGAFLFSAFVGVFFGLYPAVRAARLNPIEALRHE